MREPASVGEAIAPVASHVVSGRAAAFVLPGPDVGRLLLDRLVAEGVRYGRDFALVRIVVPLGTAEGIAPLLDAILRDADVVVRWEADELLGAAAGHGPGGRRARRAAPA